MKTESRSLLGVIVLAIASQNCGKITADLKDSLTDAKEGLGADAREKKNDDQTGGASQSEMDAFEKFVSPEDFTAFDASAVKNVPQAMLLSELSDERAIYANKPENSAAEGSAAEDENDVMQCVDKVLASGRIYGSKNKIVFAIDFAGPCEGFKEVSWKTSSGLQCEGVDFSQFNGKQLEGLMDSAESPDADFQDNCGAQATMKTFFQQKVKMVYEVQQKASGVANSQSDQKTTMVFNILSGRMTADGKPCEVLQSATALEHKGECVEHHLAKVETFLGKLSLSKTVDRKIFKTSTLKELKQNDPVWFAQGSFDVVFNNWSGTLTYAGGAAPRATMKSSAGETIDAQVPVHKPMALSSFGPTGAQSFQDELKQSYYRLMAMGE